MTGYDIELTRRVSEAVSVPVLHPTAARMQKTPLEPSGFFGDATQMSESERNGRLRI